MVRKTKTIAEVIREAKEYLKNTGVKPKRSRQHSILETVKEGAAFLEQTQVVNEKNKRQPRREIVRQLNIQKKIHKIEVQTKVDKPKKLQPKALNIQVDKKTDEKSKSAQKLPQIQPLKEQPKSKSPQFKPKIVSKSTDNRLDRRQEKKTLVSPRQKPQEKSQEKPKEKPVVQKEKEKVPKPTPIQPKSEVQPKKELNQKQKKDKELEHPKPQPKKVQKQQKAKGKQDQEKASSVAEPAQPGMKEPPVSLEESANVTQKAVKKQRIIKQEEAPQIVQSELVKEEDKQDLQVGPRKTDTQLSRDPGHPAAGIIDVVFVVDTTGSMDAYLEKTKDTVQVLVSRIKETTKEHDISVRFGFVAYRDHPPQELTYVTSIQDLCPYTEVLKFIEGLDCQGGGDGAEAVLDGINEAATKISWRQDHKIPSLRYIFHICDQPPHGREYGGYSELWDNGCLCGLKLEEVAHKVNMREIHYRLIKASATRLELMSKLFKERFSNYEDTTLELVQGEAKEMDIRISDMVIRELLPDYDYAE